MSLAKFYEKIASHDQVLLEKHAEEEKVAEEEHFAGKIMGRGFMDELNKLAMGPGMHGGGMRPMYGMGDEEKKKEEEKKKKEEYDKKMMAAKGDAAKEE